MSWNNDVLTPEELDLCELVFDRRPLHVVPDPSEVGRLRSLIQRLSGNADVDAADVSEAQRSLKEALMHLNRARLKLMPKMACRVLEMQSEIGEMLHDL